MITTQFLYQSKSHLLEQLANLNAEKTCVVQIFTNELRTTQAVELAQTVQNALPLAKIVGTSVSSVIYQGEQYDNRTLIVAEQYIDVTVTTHMVSMAGKQCEDVVATIDRCIGNVEPTLMRLFIGSYYDYAHQLINALSTLRPSLKIVGGMSGELHSFPKDIPFVFNAEQSLTEGLVFCTLESASLMVYGRINTAHETIGDVYTITDAKDRAILAIEGEPAQKWLQRNFGLLSTKAFASWEDIAQNDPLVRLQLALEEHKKAIRFIRYDENTQEISQYFSRLPAGSKFRISYTSPSKCAEESLETCHEIATTPIEQIFCYSCLFRKLYLKNCAKWELSPYHKNHINGVFLLGEFGYSEDGNALLNGSCVLSGVAEQMKYLAVDMSRLEALDDIRNEDEKLMDFIIRKQRETSSHENQKVLEDMIAHESNQLINPYQRMDVGVPIGDMRKYEQDKTYLRFNKLCLIRAENADVLMSYKGQLHYLSYLKSIVQKLCTTKGALGTIPSVHVYSIKADTFLIAANASVHHKTFHQYVLTLQKRCEELQKAQSDITLLVRFILVRNHPFLLERAFALMEDNRTSQLHLVIDNPFDTSDLDLARNDVADEMACLHLIQEALKHDNVVPYYQGIYNNQTNRVDKYEALMRIRDAKGNVYAPGHFMEIAKKYRLYLDLNLKMFHAVLRDFKHFDCGMSINLSVHDILSPIFRQEMKEALQTCHNPKHLTFELLEDEYVANTEGLVEFITEVRSYGVKIAVDDFGAGYSNMLEILKIRPDFLKIDGQIVCNLNEHAENETILEAVVLLGKRLSIDLVAEFVENTAIQERILAHGIYYSQGNLFSKPQPFADALAEAKNKWQIARSTPALLAPSQQKALPSITQEPEHQGCPLFAAMQDFASDLLFRFTLQTSCLQCFGETQRELGFSSLLQPFPQKMIESDMIPAEDIPTVLLAVDHMRRGLEEPFHFRIYNRDHQPEWYTLEYKIVFDQKQTPLEVMGKLTNIQKQKDIEMRIHTDALTGCLRKESFENLVKEYMQENPDSRASLFIIDLDNFKAVNDNLGHQFGDRVLRGAGEKLREIFRESDFVGRIGGDEFMVLMRGADNIELVKKKADDVLAALNASYKGAAHSYRVSSSIGIARYPEQGADFQALYDHADMALFDAKNRGKNAYGLYHHVLSKGTMENTLPFDVAARTLAQHFDPQVVSEVFNLLFETHEFELSIQTVLELIGKRFSVSRCYIFEQHPSQDAYQNTYEWCNKGISSEQWRLQAVSRQLFQEFFDQANSEGILYSNDLNMLQQQEGRDIMEAQGIQSFLHAYIPSGDHISYIIGIDDCDARRIWTPIEISTILHASKVIAQFLSHKKVTLDIQSIAHEHLSVLDSLNHYAYIIDRNTYELTYFNRKTKEVVPDIALGQLCYQTIRKKAAPCADCPLHTMQQKGVNDVLSVVSDSVLCRKLLTMATVQPCFAGRESVFISGIVLDDINTIQVLPNAPIEET